MPIKTNPVSGRVRDTQRQRCYDAESAIQTGADPKLRNLADMQAFIDKVTEARWFQSRWGRISVEVRAGQRHTRAVSYGRVLHIPLWAREEEILLHELAHTLTSHRVGSHIVSWHGPEFAGVLLFLVKNVMGLDAWEKLRKSFKEHRVRFNNKCIPPAKSYSVRTKTQVAAAARARSNRPVSLSEIVAATDVLRRAARQGAFGETGRKPRTHALSTARALENWKSGT